LEGMGFKFELQRPLARDGPTLRLSTQIVN
jgi:hypothetical protein